MYAGDFLSSPDVLLMYTHEVGAYMLLLLNSWQGDRPGYLLNDENRLMRTTRLTVEQWAESKEILLKKWPVVNEDSSLRYNPRLVKEAAKQQFNREQKVRAGQASAAKRSTQTIADSSVLTSVQHTAPSIYSAQHPSAESQRPHNAAATPVATERNGCSKKRQQKANLSSSISSSIPSSLRSEGAANAAPSRASIAKEKCIPTLEEVQAHAAEKHHAISKITEEVVDFFNYYESNGWRIGGRTPVKKWKAAFDRWISNRNKFQILYGLTASPAPTRASIAPRPADSHSYS